MITLTISPQVVGAAITLLFMLLSFAYLAGLSRK